MIPELLTLRTLHEVLEWYQSNLCNTQLIDPRGHRVRFNPEDFVHLIQLKTKYGKEPKNRRLTIEEIRQGRLQFHEGRFSRKRASELTWAREICIKPDFICGNWQVLGRGNELYVRNFGMNIESPEYRVLVCKVVGTIRQVVTLFPRERISEKELRGQIWTQKARGPTEWPPLPNF